MSLRIRNLASGSAGNATLVEARGSQHTTRLLIDCGVRPAELPPQLDPQLLGPRRLQQEPPQQRVG